MRKDHGKPIMHTLMLDLAADEKEDALRDEIDALDAQVRAEGQIGDLVRLRDARVIAGAVQKDAVMPSVLQRPGRSPLAAPEAEREGGLPVVRVHDLDAVRAGLHHFGAVVVRDVSPARRALDVQRMYEEALAAKAEFLALQDDQLPDIRHTDSKGFFAPLAKHAALPESLRRGIITERDAFYTFMSPRISFELCDIFVNAQFKLLCQRLLRDEVRFDFRGCQIVAEGHSVPQSCRAAGYLLWMPLSDWGDAAQGDQGAGPPLSVGDVILMKGGTDLARDLYFTSQPSLAVCLHVIAKSQVGDGHIPVFW